MILKTSGFIVFLLQGSLIAVLVKNVSSVWKKSIQKKKTQYKNPVQKHIKLLIKNTIYSQKYNRWVLFLFFNISLSSVLFLYKLTARTKHVLKWKTANLWKMLFFFFGGFWLIFNLHSSQNTSMMLVSMMLWFAKILILYSTDITNFHWTWFCDSKTNSCTKVQLVFLVSYMKEFLYENCTENAHSLNFEQSPQTLQWKYSCSINTLAAKKACESAKT